MPEFKNENDRLNDVKETKKDEQTQQPVLRDWDILKLATSYLPNGSNPTLEEAKAVVNWVKSKDKTGIQVPWPVKLIQAYSPKGVQPTLKQACAKVNEMAAKWAKDQFSAAELSKRHLSKCRDQGRSYMKEQIKRAERSRELLADDTIRLDLLKIADDNAAYEHFSKWAVSQSQRGWETYMKKQLERVTRQGDHMTWDLILRDLESMDDEKLARIKTLNYPIDIWRESNFSYARAPLTRDQTKRLARILRSTVNLEAIDLRDNRLGPEGFRILSSSLVKLPAFSKLCLSSNRLGYEGACIFRDMFSGSKVLRHVDVDNNYFYDPAAEVLGQALRKLPNIEYVDLSQNGIMHLSAATAIAKSIEGKLHLTHFIMVCNELEDKCATVLGNSFLTLPKLKRVALTGNFINNGSSVLKKILSPKLAHISVHV
jgi:hypothetical protein